MDIVPNEFNTNVKPNRILRYKLVPNGLVIMKNGQSYNHSVRSSGLERALPKPAKSTMSSDTAVRPQQMRRFSFHEGMLIVKAFVVEMSLDKRKKEMRLKSSFESSDVLTRITARFRMSSKNVVSITSTELPSPPRVLRIPTHHTKSDKSLNLIGIGSKPPITFSESFFISKRGLLTIEVADTGCGIPEKEQSHLFLPFTQANKEVQHKFGGTGLGLWFCRKLILAMNGTIECSSKFNKGSSFKVKIEVNSKNYESEPNSPSVSPLSSFNVVCLRKNEKEIANELNDLGCNIIPCENAHKLMEVVSNYESKGQYCIMIGLKTAQKIQALNKSLLKIDRTIIITSI